MQRPSLPLVFALAAAAPCNAQEPDAEALVQKARDALKAFGRAVPDSVGVSTRTAAEVIEDLDAHQDVLLPRDAYPVLFAVRHGLGLPGGRDAEALRKQAVAGAARGLSAYYDPIQKTFVLLNTATRDTTEALGGMPILVAHELVHACQDAREGGLAGLFGAGTPTIDTAHARRCVIEGEAELVAITAVKGEAVMRQALATPIGSTLDKLFAGELTGTIYQAGRRLALQRYDAGGDEALLALWKAPPASTEQALHPSKIGRDVPTAVDVPAIEGLARAHTSTLGELTIHDLLRQAGADQKAAGLAATGWDGDRVVVFEGDDKRSGAVVWRSVWDREQDAREFAAALPTRRQCAVVHDGRVVDWIHARDNAVRERVAAACAATRPQPARDEADEASTAAAEQELLAALPQDEAADGFWHHPKLGLAIPMPEGWEVREVNGMKLLLDSATVGSGFAVNINVQTSPRGAIATLQQLIEANEQQIGTIAGLEADAFAIGKRGETEVIEGEYHGRIGKMQPMHFLAVLWLQGDDQVVVTATTLEKNWEAHAPTLRKILDGLRITPP